MSEFLKTCDQLYRFIISSGYRMRLQSVLDRRRHTCCYLLAFDLIGTAMPIPESLPDLLLIEMGKVTTIWANVEQDLLLHASAMAAQNTSGKPTEYLRLDFKRLREKWYSLCRDCLPEPVMNRTVNTLNSNLAKLSVERGYYVHGLWKRIGRSRFELSYWEQKANLRLVKGDLTLTQIRRFVEACHRTSIDLHRFSTGEYDFVNRNTTFTKITASLVPVDRN